MKIRTSRASGIFRHFLRCAPLLAIGGGLAHAVPVGIPAEADIGVSENSANADGSGAVSDSSSFNAPNVNVRFTNTNRNEVIVLRFNLAGHNRADIAAAAVKLTNYAANAATTYRLWGVNDGATGSDATTSTDGVGTDDDWPEATTKFATTPSLEFDANSKTRGNLTSRSTDLGTVSVAAPFLAEGTEASLSTAALKNFLTSHPDDIVTIIVTSETTSTGIKRFASKEATALGSGGAAQPAGTFAPRLVIDLPGQRFPAVADAEFNESTTAATGNGTNTVANARWVYLGPGNSSNRNDVIGLRFDLTGVPRAEISGAQVRLVNNRDNTTVTPLHFYGVIDGATGYDVTTGMEGTPTDNDWPEETTTFATMPGIEYDADNATSGIRSDRTVDLGEVATSAGAGNLGKGSYVSLSSPGLTAFLQNHPDDIVTILVVDPDPANGGQKRFATREATMLDGDIEPLPAGTYAPEIDLLFGGAVAAPAEFRITGFSGAPGADNITLTWLSQPGETYAISYSQTLADGFPNAAASGISASAGATTSATFPNPLPAADTLFFRVSKP